MRRLDASRSRAALLCWVVAIFAVSAVTELRWLAGLWAVAAALLWRGALRAVRRVLLAVVPLVTVLAVGSWAWLRLLQDHPPAFQPFATLAVRAGLIGFLTFATLERVDLLRALAPFPTLTRLLVVALAQIHALRLVATESRLGLRSRLLEKARARDVVRNAGGLTATLFTLSARNARDIGDALRSRGF